MKAFRRSSASGNAIVGELDQVSLIKLIDEFADEICAINDLVEQRLRDAFETRHTVNVPDLASEMTESLADLIVCSAPPEEQSLLMAHVVEELGRLVKEKREAGVGARVAVDVVPKRRGSAPRQTSLVSLASCSYSAAISR